jgi:hypothetical protein
MATVTPTHAFAERGAHDVAGVWEYSVPLDNDEVCVSLLSIVYVWAGVGVGSGRSMGACHGIKPPLTAYKRLINEFERMFESDSILESHLVSWSKAQLLQLRSI